MNIFEAVKENVTAYDVATMIGLKPNRSKMVCCPFHDDRHPSMKVDTRYYCFGCGAKGDAIDFAIDVNVPDENIVKRMSGRRACLSCGATYHIEHIPPKKEGICDKCGQELVLRDDDKPETVLNRLKVYHDQTQPLIDFYTKKNVLKTVDGTKDMKEVFADIVAILG